MRVPGDGSNNEKKKERKLIKDMILKLMYLHETSEGVSGKKGITGRTYYTVVVCI